jgi:hypothetical protein
VPANQSHDLDDVKCEYTGYAAAIQGPAQCGFAPQVGGSNVAAAATSGGVTSGWGQTGPPRGGNAVTPPLCAQPSSPIPTGWSITTAQAIVTTDSLVRARSLRALRFWVAVFRAAAAATFLCSEASNLTAAVDMPLCSAAGRCWERFACFVDFGVVRRGLLEIIDTIYELGVA